MLFLRPLMYIRELRTTNWRHMIYNLPAWRLIRAWLCLICQAALSSAVLPSTSLYFFNFLLAANIKLSVIFFLSTEVMKPQWKRPPRTPPAFSLTSNWGSCKRLVTVSIKTWVPDGELRNTAKLVNIWTWIFILIQIILIKVKLLMN